MQASSRGWKGWSEQKKRVKVLVPGDVEKCLNELGIDYKVSGQEAMGRCPAHYERTGKEDDHPSWSVNMDTGFHNCFSCGFRGSFASLVVQVLDLSWADAEKWVKERGTLDRIERELLGQYIHEIEEAEEITEADLALYVPVPDRICENRNLDPSLVDHYGILWDKEKQAWITPVRDPETARLWGWQEKGESRRIFVNQPVNLRKSRTLFGIDNFTGDVAVLVESPLDVVRLHTVGIHGGLAIMGRTVSQAQLDILRDRCRTVICALDNDRDGVTASEELKVRGKGMFRLLFFNYGDTDAKDPGDMTAKEIRRAMAEAFPAALWSRT